MMRCLVSTSGVDDDSQKTSASTPGVITATLFYRQSELRRDVRRLAARPRYDAVGISSDRILIYETNLRFIFLGSHQLFETCDGVKTGYVRNLPTLQRERNRRLPKANNAMR